MPEKKSSYLPALDGLRAFAVLAVVAYHLKLPWAPGGLLGVTVFFVLSGYLITSLLLVEWDKTGSIDLPQFWLRRVRRLFPAIVLVILCAAALCALFDHSLLTKLREDMWAALLWFSNWWYIFHNASYFEALGAPSPLTHFWSLAIEEQFYLLWPVALLLAHRLGAKRTTMRNLSLALALLSALEMALLYNPQGDPSRVYYGTDTRAFSLLIGAWLAFVWPSRMLGARRGLRLRKPARKALDAAGVVAAVGLAALVVFMNGFSPLPYRGGILLVSVLTAVVIAAMVRPASLLGRMAGTKPLVWIGVRSYGIYLWHFPLLLLMNPQNATGEKPLWLYPVQIAVIFACAAASFRFVEDPIRRGGIGKLVRGVREGQVSLSSWMKRRSPLLAVGSLVLVAALAGLVVIPSTSAVGGGELLKQEGPQTAQPSAPPSTEDADQGQVEVEKLDVLMIGDSVSVRTIPYFKKAFPYGAIDAAVNRQLFDAVPIFESYDRQKVVGGVVVFALGTNGAASDDKIDELIDAVGPKRQVFFVNTRSPQPWVAATNEGLARAAQRHGNVSVIDWYDASSGHDEYFDGDGTHVNETGAQAYIDLVHDAVAPHLPEHPAGARPPQVDQPSEASGEEG